METQLMKKLVDLVDQGVPVALVTVTSKLGSSPRDMGSMMIVNERGELLAGTIGGGKVEETAKMDAASCIRTNQSQPFKYELTLKDTEHSLGMACGGEVEIFVKVFSVEDEIVIFGGGHIGLDLAKMATQLNFKVTVIDNRPEYIEASRFPMASRRLLFDTFEKEPFEINDKTSVVIVTHGHSYDLEALRTVIHSKARFIGMIGSKNKISHCFRELLKEGVEESLLKRIHAPIGLDIGGQTPPEIALAILAEIQAVKYNRTGGFLR